MSARNDCINDIVDDPPIQRMWPCSSSANWPKDSLKSSSTLNELELEVGEPASARSYVAADLGIAVLAALLDFDVEATWFEPERERPADAIVDCPMLGAICANRDSMWRSRDSSSWT